jgi:hypothetical protein
MKAIQGFLRTVFLGFFASHIFASVLIDSQAILPPAFVPSALRRLLSWYAQILNDPLMTKPQEILWFRSLICCELLFQVPFFFVACYFLKNSSLTSYPETFRYACIAYGAHTATTMVPILATVATNQEASQLEKAVCLAVYLPYLIFPVWILLLASRSSPIDSKRCKKD